MELNFGLDVSFDDNYDLKVIRYKRGEDVIVRRLDIFPTEIALLIHKECINVVCKYH
jgi:hypothetical protein